MAAEIKVPTLGESVSEATVAQWLKKAGDSVAADEAVVELETDKVTLEVNAPEAGVLAEIVAEEGDTVEVGALLGRIGEGGGKASVPAKQEASKQEAPKQETKQAAEPEPEKEEDSGEDEAAKQAPSKAAGSGNGAGKPVEIKVPALGESVTEATVAQWLKQTGDSVAADEALVELETDKVTLEVNAPAAGTLSDIKVKEGATVEVGALLGVISAGEGGGAASAAAQAKPAEDGKRAPEKIDSPTQAVEEGDTGAGSTSGRLTARGLAPGDTQEGTPADIDPSGIQRSGAEGKITAEDLRAFILEGTPPSAATLSPAVAKLIADKGIDPNTIQGTGPKGRITKEDVLNAASGEAAPAPAQPEPSAAKPAAKPATGTSGERPSERVKMPKLRQTIARRLKEAQNTAAMLTTFNEADMTEVMALRGQFKESFEKKHGVRLGFTSFFAKAAVKALKEVPAVNARIDGEEIVYNKYYDIGMAVSTPNGLMVPVIRNCDGKSFAEIEASLGELAGKGRDGKLSLDEMQGGTFTITNGGVFGSLLSTPILNMPQSGILGLHKIQERPMAIDGEVEIRPMMYLALSYDHRIIDGREAVTFLVKLKEAIEDPSRLLLDM
ncbi:MAG: 2-oxoglutarate dehydrogenase complex dihydrolipoyllysine-residue succinyltransferase [Rhodovibrionaceae bacterium]